MFIKNLFYLYSAFYKTLVPSHSFQVLQYSIATVRCIRIRIIFIREF